MPEVFTTRFTKPDDSRNHLDLLRGLIDSARGTIHVVISHFSGNAAAASWRDGSSVGADVVPSHFSCDAAVSNTLGEDATISGAFNAAIARGVTVRAIVRCDQRGHGLVVPQDGASELIQPSGCFGNSLHTKLFLFEETIMNDGRDARFVSVIGSFTLTGASARKHQNAVCVEDEVLYTVLQQQWETMKEKGKNKVGLDCEAAMEDPLLVEDCSTTAYSSQKKVSVYLFPFRSGDPIVNTIRKFRGAPNGDERPLARVAMARWTSGRDEIVEAVRDKLKEGVRFWMVLRVDADNGVDPAIYEVFKKLRKKYPDQLELHKSVIGTRNIDVHSKYLTYKGYYGEGEDWERLVWTGSVNWTTSALRSNDEILFKIRDETTYDAFAQNFKDLKDLISVD